MRLSSALIIVTASLTATPAFAQSAWFPLSPGNEWTYADSGFGAQPGAKVTIKADTSGTGGGQTWVRLQGYNGGPHWLRALPTGRVVEYPNKTWYELGAAKGSSWTLAMNEAGTVPCTNGARVEVVSRNESVTVPGGTFATVHLRFTSTCADAGITDEWFANGIGLVKRSQSTFGGPRTLTLERAVVNGKQVAPAIAPPPVTPPVTPPPSSGKGAFGIEGSVPASKVNLRVILDKDLARPMALQFNPHAGSLWIVNALDDRTVIVDNAGTGAQKHVKFFDDSHHFMNNPTAIAFSRTRNEFATTQETGNDYDGHAHPNMFMGPSLFTADRKLFEGGTKSHLDMLHHSPFAMGIAAGAKPKTGPDRREYWVVNGHSGCIDRYFFNEPHALGADDHSDGLTLRYGSGLKRVAQVPSHAVLDEATSLIYVADTGNGRIVKLDTRTSTGGATQISGHHAETPLYRVNNAKLQAVTTTAAGLVRPAGLILKDGKLVVSDHATGRIKVLASDGTVLGDADTGLGSGALTGLAETPTGRLYLLDAKKHRVLELEITP